MTRIESFEGQNRDKTGRVKFDWKGDEIESYVHSFNFERSGETKFGLIDRHESYYRCVDGAFVLGTNSFLMYRSFLQAKANCSFRR